MAPQPQQQQQPIAVRTVNPGDRVNIPCSLANLGGSIQFAKDDQPIILDSGCAQCQLDISNEGQASLTINRVSRRDQGHWQCWRLDSAGKVKQKIPIVQLVVTNSPELPVLVANDKELLGDNNLDATITVKENEPVVFKCVIKGAVSPVDYVHWMLDSSQNLTQLAQLLVEYMPDNNGGSYQAQSILKLAANKTMNLKSISCLSNHQLWLTPKTVTAFLNVLYEPSFIISREPGFGVAVSEGMNVVLKCEIDSNPPSTPVWIKDANNKTASANQQPQQQQVASAGPGKDGASPVDEPIVLETHEDGAVVFQPAEVQHTGWYRCKTENKYGNFSSFGYYLNVRPQTVANQLQPPVGSSTGRAPLQQQQHSVPSRAGEHHHHHQASGSRVMAPNQPAAQPIVSGNGQYISNNNNQYQRVGQQQQQQHQFSQPGSSNIINNDQPTFPSPFSPSAGPAVDGGAPSNCGNAAGRPDGSPHIIPAVSVVNAVLGRQLILPLKFCCNPGPTRVFWIHRHLAMIPGRMFGPYITRDIYSSYNSVYCYESTFEIESVKLEDIGTVYVFVSNEKGHTGAQIHIQLAKSQEPTQPALGARFPLSASSSSSSPSSPSPTTFILLNLLLLVGCISSLLINWRTTLVLNSYNNR